MRLSARFKRLSLWNKLFVIGSLASIISLPLSAILFLVGQRFPLSRTTLPESSLTTQPFEGLKPLTENQAMFKAIIGLIVSKTELTSEDKAYSNELLSTVSYEDIKGLIERLPEQSERRSLASMLRSKRLTVGERVTGLAWNGSPLAVRFLQSNDPSLDFKKTTFYSDDYSDVENPYVSKDLDLGLPNNVSVQACETRRRLELLIIRQPGS